jgi:hypothetical protein
VDQGRFPAARRKSLGTTVNLDFLAGNFYNFGWLSKKFG